MKVLNTLNRIVIVVICLVLILVFTAIAIVPQVVLSGVGTWMAEWGAYLGRQTPWLRLIVGAMLAVIIDFVLALIIFIEVRPARQRYINVQQVSGGMATVSIESVNQLLINKLDPLPGVLKISPHIRARGSKVEAVVDAEVARDTNVPSMANQMIKVIQEALNQELGLQISGQPEVRVNVATEEGRATQEPERPQPSPAPQGPPPLPRRSSGEGHRENETVREAGDQEGQDAA
jgi:hypothetical protein